MFMQKISLIILSVLAGLAVLMFDPNTGLADGTETLDAPAGITLAKGTGIVAAGVGTAEQQPATINLDVPAAATVRQVLLYWEGQMTTEVAGDNTILVNGDEVTGQLIGGPTFFFQEAYSSAYRADITALGLIHAGANAVVVDGLAFSKVANGAGLFVIYDDGTQLAEIDLRDGLDLAYINFPEPRKSTIQQTFTFRPAATPRMAEIVLFASSVEGAVSGGIVRPNSIEVIVGDDTTVFTNLLNSNDGDEWDTVMLQVAIPSGASSLSIQLFSRNDADPARTQDPKPASMAWTAAGFAIVPSTPSIDIEKATNGEDADTPTGPEIVVGDPVNWHYVVVNTGNVTLNDVVVTDDQGITVNCPQTILTPAESMTCSATGVATAGQYANVGSVVGIPTDGGNPVTDRDPSHYVGLGATAAPTPTEESTQEPTTELTTEPTPCTGENCPTPAPTKEQTQCICVNNLTPDTAGLQTPEVTPVPTEDVTVEATGEPTAETTPCTGEGCVTPDTAGLQTPEVTPSPTCTAGLFGKLVDAVGVGLPNWTISAQFVDASEPALRTETDGTGTFVFRGLQPGHWIVRYELQSGWSAVSAQQVEVVVAEAVGCVGVVFTIQQQPSTSLPEPTAIPGCLITYRQYADGSAIRDLATWQTTVHPVDNDTPTHEATVDTTGYAKFSDLPPGEWVLKQQLQSGQSCIPNAELQVTVPSGPLCVALYLGCTPPEKAVPTPMPTVAPPSGRVAGVVVDDNHVGLPGWQIMAKPVDAAEPMLTMSSNGTGAFEFRHLKPGRWILWEVVPAGWGTVTAAAFEVTVPADPACVQVRFKNRQN